jgi:hypothetical protein
VISGAGDGDEVVLVDAAGGPVPHPSTPDEDGSRTVAVELRNSFGTTLKYALPPPLRLPGSDSTPRPAHLASLMLIILLIISISLIIIVILIHTYAFPVRRRGASMLLQNSKMILAPSSKVLSLQLNNCHLKKAKQPAVPVRAPPS